MTEIEKLMYSNQLKNRAEAGLCIHCAKEGKRICNDCKKESRRLGLCINCKVKSDKVTCNFCKVKRQVAERDVKRHEGSGNV